jgi:hypothetical protein
VTSASRLFRGIAGFGGRDYGGIADREFFRYPVTPVLDDPSPLCATDAQTEPLKVVIEIDNLGLALVVFERKAPDAFVGEFHGPDGLCAWRFPVSGSTWEAALCSLERSPERRFQRV